MATQFQNESLTDRWPQTLVKMAPTKAMVLLSSQDELKEKWQSQWVELYFML